MARGNTLPHTFTVTVLAAAALGLFSGCSPKTDDQSSAASITVSNVTLTAAQRPNIHIYTVARSTYHRIITTTGEVDFDNDQATSVLAP